MKIIILPYFRTYRKFSWMIFLIGISLIILPTANGYLPAMTKLDLYLKHDLIFYGQVLSLKEIEKDIDLAPKTTYEIKILQYVKGNYKEEKITVIGNGAFNSTIQMEDQTILTKNQLVLLMVNEIPDGRVFISPYSVASDNLNPDTQFILPPMKLYKSGIFPEDIHCKSSLKLALKSVNQDPVCLKPKSFDILYERGWIQ